MKLFEEAKLRMFLAEFYDKAQEHQRELYLLAEQDPNLESYIERYEELRDKAIKEAMDSV